MGSVRLFGDVLQEVRQAKGLTQQALADGAKIPISTLRNYEQNKRSPSFENAIGMARTLAVPLETFAACSFVCEQERTKKEKSAGKRKTTAKRKTK